ncbi:sialic acid-binding Ig-like lectin 12 [Toxotes jaculatrix]|uniref:sialic acid-binding Ig-like lectin 12 n=1 Tax=Toxotes jaculatrix TaxID=941984 RepID=UPI001B3AC332|nr:sialic acid-binding Ig-like lectin 12 [Toxotes jaculatrix]
MKLLGLIPLCLTLILASPGQLWKINVPRHINATLGSNVTILCNFSYPEMYHTDKLQVYWKRRVKSSFNTYDNDQYQYVFHTNDTYVFEWYRGKTMLIGNKAEGNCSLRILNITHSDMGLYVRLIEKEQKFSFYDKSVCIDVSGTSDIVNITSGPILNPTDASVERTQDTQIYVSICVPLSALLIIFLIIGISCGIKHKRKQSFRNEESGYYANFSSASSNQTQRIQASACGKNHENKKLPELKVIDEPVYINTEAITDQMGQSMDRMDNVYANVDFSK